MVECVSEYVFLIFKKNKQKQKQKKETKKIEKKRECLCKID